MWVTGNMDCATNPTAVGKAAPLAIFLCLTLKRSSPRRPYQLSRYDSKSAFRHTFLNNIFESKMLSLRANIGEQQFETVDASDG